MSYRNVCEAIVPFDLCIGCGLCVGVCPPKVLNMEFNEYGEYIPIEFKDGCLPKCDLCLQACPFWDQDENEDTLGMSLFGEKPEVSHSMEVGYYQDCFVGYSRIPNQRLNGSSGGVATWFLDELMRKDIVDHVGCVTSSDDPDALYKFEILDDIESISRASKSCYYPVHLGDVIHQILTTEGRYAITGLPCFIKGLRLAMRKNRRLRRRIVVLVGLVCGQTKSKFFVEYLAQCAGAKPDSTFGVEFRIKDPQRSAPDYGHRFMWADSDQINSRTLYWKEGIEQAWSHDYFKPNACNYCDDIFAELADVTFMDAWLPEYSSDYRGHTLIVNRSRDLSEFWDNALSADNIELERINVDSVIRSQRGVLKQKRIGMQYRLDIANRLGHVTPQKRFPRAKPDSFIDRYLWSLKLATNRESRSLWRDNSDARKFRRKLYTKDIQIRFLRFALRVERLVRDGRIFSALKKRIYKMVGKTVSQ